MYKIFTPVWRIVGEFITLGTLYNDMGIDCMEINGIQGQTTPDSGPEARPGGFRGSHFGGVLSFISFTLKTLQICKRKM